MAPAMGRRGFAAAAVALAVGGAAAASSIGASAHSTKAKLPTAPKGFNVSVFAKATAAFWNPDSIEVAGNHVWVGFQNTTSKTGSDGLSSTIVEYSLSGKLRATFAVLGHVDGVRVNPSTGLVWVLSNEDANPHLTTIDPVTGLTKQYAMTSVNGGGGYDDIAFLGGKAYISASNPANNPNDGTAIVSATLDNATDSVDTTPVLPGTVAAHSVVDGSAATLNLQDPDSMYVTPSGDLQLDDQGDAQLVFIHNPGPGQVVTFLPIGNQMDDTIFPTSASGTLLVSDTTKTGAVYAIKSKQWDTTRYVSSAPSDSSVAAYVGTIDPSTGVNKPLITGFANPHGEAFIPKTGH